MFVGHGVSSCYKWLLKLDNNMPIFYPKMPERKLSLNNAVLGGVGMQNIIAFRANFFYTILITPSTVQCCVHPFPSESFTSQPYMYLVSHGTGTTAQQIFFHGVRGGKQFYLLCSCRKRYFSCHNGRGAELFFYHGPALNKFLEHN